MNSDRAGAHVIELEQGLLDPAVRSDVAQIEPLLHVDFVEHGASGRVWTRQAVLDELPLEGEDTPVVSGRDFRFDLIAPATILLTYVSESTARTCNRSSLWLEVEPGTWQMRFHQGTPVSATTST